MNYMTPKDTWNRQLFKDLSDKAMNATSQYGEDGIIEAIFTVCRPEWKWCVDVGAGDGFSLSNTWSLIDRGWNAILIEKVEATMRDGKLYSGYLKIVERFKSNPNVWPVYKEVIKDNLDIILMNYPIPYKFDFLSLDIDSYDADIWENLVRHKPKLVCIECDESVTDLNKVSYRLDRPNACNPASVGYLKQIAEKKGYDFVCATACNAFFIEREFGRSLRIK